MSWRIVYVSEVNDLSLHMNSLKVKKGDQEVKIPLADIFAVVLEDLTVRVTSRLLIEMSHYDITVILCNQKHLPECSILPISGHFAQYSQMSKQLLWENKKKDILWKYIINQKIENQLFCMDNFWIDEDRIEKVRLLRTALEPADPKNIEGQVAKMYFFSFFGSEFSRDNSELIENAVLNYGYAILNAAIARTIVVKGLIPAIGVHHRGPTNHFNLASDFIEPFRPIVDYYLLENPPSGYLTKDYRIQLINLMHARVDIAGKSQTVIRAIEIMIQSIIDYFESGDESDIMLPSIQRLKLHEL